MHATHMQSSHYRRRQATTAACTHFFCSALLVYNSHRPVLLGNRFRYPSASRRALGADAREFDAAAAYGIVPSAAEKGLRLPEQPGGDYEIAIPGIWIGRGAA